MAQPTSRTRDALAGPRARHVRLTVLTQGQAGVDDLVAFLPVEQERFDKVGLLGCRALRSSYEAGTRSLTMYAGCHSALIRMRLPRIAITIYATELNNGQ